MKTKTDTRRSDEFVVHTTQEIDALGRATANGKSFNGYTSDEQAGRVAYNHAAIPHCIELSLNDSERRGGMTVAHLEAMVRAQDADALLAQLYIMSILAHPLNVGSRGAAVGWIEFDDVIEKIGWTPRSSQERRAMHKRIWDFMQFGERAAIIGERSTPYKNPHTKKKIETTVKHPVWLIGSKREPVQGELGFGEQVPIAVEIVMVPAIVELIMSPLTAQFLPMGEALGAISGGQASGAWARVIGLSLMNFWRRHRENALSGHYKPTRRELLTHYPPKVAEPLELLASRKNVRAIEYWCDALQLLVTSGILADEGETRQSAKEIRQSLPARGWQNTFLNERLELMPGYEMRSRIDTIQLKSGKTALKSGSNELKSGKT